MSDKALRIVQITDPHLFVDDTQELLGVKTQLSFEAVLDLLAKDPVQPSLILLTGDLAQDETEKTYLYVANAMKRFPVPAYWIPGNHDCTKVMARIFPRETISNHKHIVLEHWHIILLDTQKYGHVEGYLDHIQLKFLQHCLDMYPEHQALVVLHHHPFPMGSAWIDQLGVTNANEFWQTIAHYPRVNTVLCGHVHQEKDVMHGHVRFISSPSTCIQFKGNIDDFFLDELNPGYRWLDLYPNGELKTGVNRIPHYIGTFDKNAKGY